MDSRNTENHLKKYDEKTLEKIQSKAVFSDPAYHFVFKKTEKIIAALYLVTNLISDTEPIKGQLRKLSLDLMSLTLDLKKLSLSQSQQTLSVIFSTISEIISLLKIASISDQISPMNHSVLYREFVMLMSSFESVQSDTIGKGSVSIPTDFFNVPAFTAPTISHSASTFSPSNFHQVSSKGQYRTSQTIKDNQVVQPGKDTIKDTRHQKMLNMLKDGKSLGIKDFSKEIKGCSEKTLQRELLSMVESGVLKKTGERRWSLYSLA